MPVDPVPKPPAVVLTLRLRGYMVLLGFLVTGGLLMALRHLF